MDTDPSPLAARPQVTGGMCEPFVAALYLDGASVYAFGQDGPLATICASDAVALEADALQRELNEGPHWEALHTGRMVMSPDLAKFPSPAWPRFAAAARDLGIGAVFSVPMRVGAGVVGVVDLYSRTPRRLDRHQAALASTMADRLAATLNIPRPRPA